MPIEYRHLTKNELDTFIEMRINQLREEGAKEDIDLRPALKAYYLRHLADGIFVSWLAFDGEKNCGNKRNVLRGKAAVLRLPKRKNRPAFKCVHKSYLPEKRNRKGTFKPRRKRSKRLWLRNSSDNGIRYGRKTVH